MQLSGLGEGKDRLAVCISSISLSIPYFRWLVCVSSSGYLVSVCWAVCLGYRG